MRQNETKQEELTWNATKYDMIMMVIRTEVTYMATHHGGKVGAAAKTLASSSATRAAKTAAAKTLVKHQIAKHR